MDKLTYRQAYDKIIEAYFKDEIEPKDANFCFCGTLCNNSDDWFGSTLNTHYDFENYTGYEYVRMERALFAPLLETFWDFKETPTEDQKNDPRYEDALFQGMANALEVLRQIHIEHGENVDEDIPAFTKRELVKAL